MVALIQEAGGMNPLFNDQSASFLSFWAQEPLFVARPDGSFDPVLAAELPTEENGGVSKGGRTVTFKLREGVTWSDGKPFTAEDLKFTFDVIQDPKSTAFPPTAYELVDSVEVVDDLTARVRMKAPNPFYLGLFQQVLPKHKFDSTAVTTEHPQARLPLGTGPFVFEEFKEGDRIVLKRNEDYWNKEERPVRLDGITLKITPDAQAAISAFQRGEFDTVFFVTSGDLPDLTEAREEGAPIEIALQETKSHVEWLWLNHSDNGDHSRPHPVLGDPAVREAIDLGIDRKAVIDEVLEGFGTLNGSVFYSGLANVDIPATPFDPERANEILDEAGWKRGADGIRSKDGVRASLRYQTITGDQTRELYQQLVQQNLEDIGIEVKINNVPSNLMFGTYQEGGRLARGNFDIMMSRDGYVVDPLDEGWAANFSCGEVPSRSNPGGQSETHWCNSEYDALVQEAASIVDEQRRKELYAQAARLFARERPALPLYSSKWGWAWSSRLKGVSKNYFDGIWRSAHDWYLAD
ncbi:MAG: peptide ABC transporter substrate-binding protein [Thermoleophilaceae bacterium]